MKKSVLFLLFVVVLLAFGSVFAADDAVVLKVGASPAPHAEILAQVVDALAEQNIKLEIIEFTDYVLPNTALEAGDLDANFFQHKPYLNDFNASYAEQNKDWTTLVPVLDVHFEPMGIFGGKTAKLEDLAEGAKIAVPNDVTNEARALLVLEAQGILTIKEGMGLNATKKDIAENPKNVELIELEAAQLPRALGDVDFAVINGNYAIEAGLKAEEMLAAEGAESEAAQLYANDIVVRQGDEERPEIVALCEALQSDAVKEFIATNYAGSVVTMF